MMGKKNIWVTDLVEMAKANDGLASYEEVYRRLQNPFLEFEDPLAKYIATTGFLHTATQYAIKQERPLIENLVKSGKSRKPYFVEQYKKNLNWLLNGTEGMGISDEDIEIVAEAGRRAIGNVVSLDTLKSKVQLLSEKFIESRYQSILSDLGRHNFPYRKHGAHQKMPALPRFAHVDLKIETVCFDEDKKEYITGKYDVLFARGSDTEPNIKKVMEIKISDPELYKQLMKRTPKKIPIKERHYDLLQVTLCGVIENFMYRSIDKPRIISELYRMDVGQMPEVAQIEIDQTTLQQNRAIGMKLFKDLVEMREDGLVEFKKRRGIK
jgi:hypothetical protein